ncbi:transporter substrate-binding domain-containing protein [Lutibaculum baratangense]|uniref:Solute-binding protein family 3/N-terminal domain-containing protein n=1 Tax=Lutibaculum baratangense AMV1 TaxID=631454 RepID=V4RNQ5_9HYPH|nr:transporter substrate-binding domain-containing protein [Lutibaculum baratangense]ESR26874.1 hypothetical protein N177_0658 [Lutibaculum baratangense AMV1]
MSGTGLGDLERQQFAPHGKMRIGIAFGKSISGVWTMPDPETGEPVGITVDLGAELARWLGLPFEYVKLASSGEIIETANQDRWDVAFTPVDADRKKVVDFTTDYYLGDSTYLVHADSPFRSVKDVDLEGVRVLGVENTATIRSARRTLMNTTAEGLNSLEDAIERFRRRDADALALGRESLMGIARSLPDTRILDDHFHATGTALAMAKGKAEALELATQFIEEAKRDGLIEKIVLSHGLSASSVAPSGSRS